MQEIGIEASVMKHVLSGKKTIEGRLRTSKFVTLRKGDHLSLREDVWQNGKIIRSVPKRAIVIITETTFYDTFTDMFEVIPFKTALPQAINKATALQAHQQFYSTSQEREHGVVAIHFSLVKNTT